ncbi:MAG: peptidoglycan editing factor PgeF [Gammaproteobacteria bacterium]|nr:peptidoglycan editing factor PgeF [Gammaproteobacteria bacterium]
MASIIKSELDWPAPSNIHAFVTSRQGGYSTKNFSSLNLAFHVDDKLDLVARNRALLQASVSRDLTFQWLRQIHSASVFQVDSSGPEKKGDGLLCKKAGIVCCILTADCLPVFFTNKHGTEIAIAHVGWRGMSKGIIQNVVNTMESNPREVITWLGPAIGPCHFEVGEEVKFIFSQSHWPDMLRHEMQRCFSCAGDPKKYFLDLYQATKVILNSMGISEVYGGDECTYCQEEKYFSFRRDGDTGRMVSAIFIEP